MLFRVLRLEYLTIHQLLWGVLHPQTAQASLDRFDHRETTLALSFFHRPVPHEKWVHILCSDAAWSRSATDGKLWWVDAVRQTSGSQNVYTWDMTNGVTLVGNTGASTTFSRAAFDENGVLYAEESDNI